METKLGWLIALLFIVGLIFASTSNAINVDVNKITGAFAGIFKIKPPQYISQESIDNMQVDYHGLVNIDLNKVKQILSKVSKTKKISKPLIPDNMVCSLNKCKKLCESKHYKRINKVQGFCLPDVSTRQINTAVIIDDSSQFNKPDSYYRQIISKANIKLTQLSNLTFKITALTHLSSNDYQLNTAHQGTTALPYIYLAQNPAPEYMIIFTRNDAISNSAGGYHPQAINSLAWTDIINNNYCSRLESPNALKKKSIVLGYANVMTVISRCGYNETAILNGAWNVQPIRTTSADGECSNQNGIGCINEAGFSVCPNWQQFFNTNATYTATQQEFAASTVVHEFAHEFGTEVNNDHFATPNCITRTRNNFDWTTLQADSTALVISSNTYLNMCPDIWQNIKNSYTSCR